MRNGWGGYPPYVSVKTHKQKNQKLAEKLLGQGYELHPVHVIGNKRHLASSFWGQSWCKHLNSFSDYENRLPRGRSYVRQGAVLNLEIEAGSIYALVSGSMLYEVQIKITPLKKETFNIIQEKCSGEIDSLLDLLQGDLSDKVMKLVANKNQGLFPSPSEISLACSCPDWAEMCKHVAAVLYGVGVRLDEEPELLFLLRGVSAQDLITENLGLTDDTPGRDHALAQEDLAGIFGIEFDDGIEALDEKASVQAAEKVSVNSTLDVPYPLGIANLDAALASLRSVFELTGVEIGQLRRDFGFSVAEFSGLLDVNKATIYRWEKAIGTVRMHKKVRNILRYMTEIREEMLQG